MQKPFTINAAFWPKFPQIFHFLRTWINMMKFYELNVKPLCNVACCKVFRWAFEVRRFKLLPKCLRVKRNSPVNIEILDVKNNNGKKSSLMLARDSVVQMQIPFSWIIFDVLSFQGIFHQIKCFLFLTLQFGLRSLKINS